MKLGEYSRVLIMAGEKGFTLYQVRQMLGRSSCAFGLAEDVYYTYEFGAKKLDIAKRQIYKEPERGNYFELVKMLYI